MRRVIGRRDAGDAAYVGCQGAAGKRRRQFASEQAERTKVLGAALSWTRKPVTEPSVAMMSGRMGIVVVLSPVAPWVTLVTRLNVVANMFALPAPAVVDRPVMARLPPLLIASAVSAVAVSCVVPPVPPLRAIGAAAGLDRKGADGFAHVGRSHTRAGVGECAALDSDATRAGVSALPVRRLFTAVAVLSMARMPPEFSVSAVALPKSTAPLPLRSTSPPLTIRAPVALFQGAGPGGVLTGSQCQCASANLGQGKIHCGGGGDGSRQRQYWSRPRPR